MTRDDVLNNVKRDFTGFCSGCNKECQVIPKSDLKNKKGGISVKGRKAKGRRAQQLARDMIVNAFGLSPEDVESVTMGTSGQDIKLSPSARQCFPFHSIEVTASPNVSPFAKFAQAQRHAEKQLSGKVPGNGRPILIFKRNGTPLFAMLLFEDLLEVLSGSVPVNSDCLEEEVI